MGIIDERNLIDGNRLKMESRINSQYARFLDTTPTYVTYYHINNIESMTDVGFINVNMRLGSESPIRYNEIKNLPIYGMDELLPSVDLEPEGLNTSITSSGVILPNTVPPYPDDLFILHSSRGSMIFRITNVQYDTIRSNNFYKIDYELEYTEDEFFQYLSDQTTEHFTCVVENIGTEDKVLLRDDNIELLGRVESVIERMLDFYKILFYDKRYNSFIYTNKEDGVRLYDSLLTRFMIDNKVFVEKGSYKSLMLSDEDPDIQDDFAYHESIYRAIEQRRPEIIKEMHFMATYVNNPVSVFHYWRDETVMTTKVGVGCDYYIRPEILDLFRRSKELFEDWQREQSVLDGEFIKNRCHANNILIPLDEGDHQRPQWVPTAGTSEINEDAPHDNEKDDYDVETYEQLVKEKEDRVDRMKEMLDKLNNPQENESVEVTTHELPLATPEKQEYDDELEKVVLFRQHEENNVIASNGQPFQVRDIPMEFERKNLKPIGESIIHHIIVMYLSGASIDFKHIDLDLLENHVEYMHPNHETFVLVPIAMYVLQKMHKSI